MILGAASKTKINGYTMSGCDREWRVGDFSQFRFFRSALEPGENMSGVSYPVFVYSLLSPGAREKTACESGSNQPPYQ